MVRYIIHIDSSLIQGLHNTAIIFPITIITGTGITSFLSFFQSIVIPIMIVVLGRFSYFLH